MIGHEISHSFDNNGAAFDSTGALRNWWTAADLAKFNAAGDALAAQFDTYKPFPDLAINGKLCVIHRPGGNWSDNGGRHYGAADITVREIKTLRRGNEPGTWRVHFVRMGASINFHPTPKVACREAMQELADRGDALVEHFSKKVV